MPTEERFSRQGLRLLAAFLNVVQQDATGETTGSDIMKATKLASGTVYPLLMSFEERKILKSRWEKQRPEDLGRPRRRLYKLTAHGASVARSAVETAVQELNFQPSVTEVA